MAAMDAQGSNCDTPVVQPVAYVTRPEVMVAHVVFECCIGRSRDGQPQGTCWLVFYWRAGWDCFESAPRMAELLLWRGWGMP